MHVGGTPLPPIYPAAMNDLNLDSSKDALPPSQESLKSGTSSLALSSCENSNFTSADTDLTSPASSNGPSSESQGPSSQMMLPKHVSNYHAPSQLPAPSDVALQVGDTAASPMSSDFPVLTQGSKRTASGAVKSKVPPKEISYNGTSEGGTHANMQSAPNPGRIGEISAQLRSRLSYAMMKVQNGWEKRSIEELTQLPIERKPSRSSQMQAEEGWRYPESPSNAEHRRRRSEMPEIQYRCAPALAPAAEIGSRRKRRSSASRVPPPLLSSAHRKYYSDLGTAIPSRQDEKDAADTLLFMSSPKNTSRLGYPGLNAHPSDSTTAPKRFVLGYPENSPLKQPIYGAQDAKPRPETGESVGVEDCARPRARVER